MKNEHMLQSRNPHDTETYVPYDLLKGRKGHDHDHDTGKYQNIIM